MFVYTKNRHVIKELQAEGCKLINKRADGVVIYALPPSSKFKFKEQKTKNPTGIIAIPMHCVIGMPLSVPWLSNSLTF